MSTALVTLISILVLTLVLPNFTTSTPSGSYNTAQLLFIAVASFVLYFSFILTQTVRHRDYFLADDEDPSHHAEPPPTQIALASLVCLVVCLGVVIALAKALSPAIESMVVSWGAPKALVGVIIAAVVLMPESLARAYRRPPQSLANQHQSGFGFCPCQHRAYHSRRGVGVLDLRY